jgi:DNA-binding NarL/FixJ family response regulator
MLSKFVNLALVDDQTLFRKILKNFLSDQNKFSVVIQSPDVLDLLSRLKDVCVDVLLLDIYVSKLNGIETIKIIRNDYPDIKILVLSMCTDMDLLSDMLDLGVYGIISKSDEPEELVNAILSLSEHRIYRNKLLTEVMYWNKQNNIKTLPNTTGNILNKRDKEILQLLWEEKSNKEIADYLFLSVRSVEKIRQDMKEKIGVKSTVGLLKYAINKNIVGFSKARMSI